MPEAAYLRYPAIRGDRFAFVTDDDVWVGSVDTGESWRLGVGPAKLRRPRFSPDGTQLAWTSDAAGAPEAWVVSLDGGEPRRLTWWGDPATVVLGWRDDTAVVVATAAGEPYAWQGWAWAVPLDAAAPERLPYGPVTAVAPAPAPSRAVVLGADQSATSGAAWKRYRGGTAGKLWIDPTGEGNFERFAAHLGGQLEDPGWVGERVVFVSDHEGWGNLYSLLPDGSDLRRHSDHGDAYARDAATDGRRVVYGCFGDLWIVDDLASGSAPRRLQVRLGSARRGRLRYVIDASGALGGYVPTADGRASAIVVRGAAVWLTHRDGPAVLLAPGGASRARLVAPLGTGHAVWVTDADGDDALEVAAVDGTGSRRLAAGELAQVVGLAASPDGAWVATAGDDGSVRVTEVASASVRVVDRSAHDIATGLAWSPDSAWLAWSHAGALLDEGALRQIRLVRVGDGAPGGAGTEVVDATPLRFGDSGPVFTPDGRYLAFLSRRTFDPVADQVRFDLAFVAATRPYLLRLSSSTPGPLSPEPDGKPLPATISAGAHPGGSAETPGEAPELDLEVQGLADRLVELPVAAGRYADLRATAGGLVWRVLPGEGELGDARAEPGAEPAKARLERLDLATGKVVTLADAADGVEVTSSGRALVVRTGSSLAVVRADRKDAAGDEEIRFELDLSRVRVTVDPPAEAVQMYAEAARLMRRHYWAEDMAGVDWDAVVARYRPLAERVATRDELHDLIWELHGEMGTSHAYVWHHADDRPDQQRLGYLGADLEAADGGWRVAAIPATEPSVPVARSPLDAAGVGVGEVIETVDGRPVDPARGPAPLLVGAAGKLVGLGVRDSAGGSRRVVVRALADERPLRYHAWVASRRAAVRERSAGRAGYLHVPDMVASGWAELNRDLRTETRSEALVVDFRHNRGGSISQLVLERLAGRVTAWENPRGFEAETYPVDAPRGPMVALVDQYAGSDGDIVAVGFRQRGLGPLIGARTWGGVVGIDMRYSLADGTVVTQPRYAFFFEGGPGWSVENHGVDPDIEVEIAPQDWAAGRDPQLARAVEEVLSALEERPAFRPPGRADRPSRVPPALGPRP